MKCLIFVALLPIKKKIDLDNWKLEKCKKMDSNTVDLLKCFFNQLNKPICLVAHNGNRFDYPILKEHLNKLVCKLFFRFSFDYFDQTFFL